MAPANPLVTSAVSAVTSVVLGRLVVEVEKRYHAWKKVNEVCASLVDDYDMFVASINEANLTGAHGRTVAGDHMRRIRELAHDIEDCLELFLHRVTCKQGASWPSRAAHEVKMVCIRYQFGVAMRKLKKRVEEERQRPVGSSKPADPSSTGTAHCVELNPEGFAAATEDLRTLLDEAEGEPPHLKVISMVGFGGSGKTTLAKAVYNKEDHPAPRFHCRAWVDRCEYTDAVGLLKKIIQKAYSPMEPAQNIMQEANEQPLRNHLQQYFKDKRYLIVLDDINPDLMDWIRTLEKNGTSSRIIVTTTNNCTADSCYKGHDGYVYRMRALGPAASKQIALPDLHALEPFAKDLLDICDGLPLALVCVADHFQCRRSRNPRELCQYLYSGLGRYLLGHSQNLSDDKFERLRGVLMDNYTTLCKYTASPCLLYLAIFPGDRPLKRDVIIRRWIAEGYAEIDDPATSGVTVANHKFQELVDCNIIRPAGTRNNEVLKTGSVHRTMHKFLLLKSISENFMLPPHAISHKVGYKKVRHIYLDVGSNSNSGVTGSSSPLSESDSNSMNCCVAGASTPWQPLRNSDLSCVRSVTIQGNQRGPISKFSKYVVMRALDLEQWDAMEDRHLRDICELWNLRYLSLGPNISELPKKIAQLSLLETLHVSKTREIVLPVEVLVLPCLVHLIGKFSIVHQGSRVSNAMKQQLKDNKLETLAGFVTRGSQGIQELMVYMKKLKKVKIWCEHSKDKDRIDALNTSLLKAIQKYTGAKYGQLCDDRSLSIYIQEVPVGSMHPLEHLYRHSNPTMGKYLRSLKLQGELPTLSECIGVFSDLEALCLSSSTVTQDLLSAISRQIPSLRYLKLIVVENMANTMIQDGALPNLKCLRFVVGSEKPILPEIQDGALPRLTSLELICEHLAGPHGINIRYLKKLKEIWLHEVSNQTRQQWEAAARNHPNMPDVLPLGYIDSPATASTEPTENSAAAAEELQPVSEVPESSSAMQTVQENIPCSTSNSLKLRDETDDPTQQEPTENPIAPEEPAAEAPVLTGEQETDHSVQLGQFVMKNSTTPSISEETCNDTTTGSEYYQLQENHAASEEAEPETGNGIGIQVSQASSQAEGVDTTDDPAAAGEEESTEEPETSSSAMHLEQGNIPSCTPKMKIKHKKIQNYTAKHEAGGEAPVHSPMQTGQGTDRSVRPGLLDVPSSATNSQ